MKSTYKLFGTVWDGMKEESALYSYDHMADNSNQNVISLEKLLTVNNAEEREKVLSAIDASDTVVLNLDIVCESRNPVIDAFLKKRFGQIVAFLSERYPLVLSLE